MLVQTAFIPYYLSTDIDFVCVLCISSSTAARRQTAPPHHTHNFCWHGPCQRSHDEMPLHFSTCPFIFSQLQRSVCTNDIYSLPPQHRYINLVCVLCTSSSTAAVASLSFPLSLSVFVQGYTSHNNIAISLPTLLFFAATTKSFYKRHSFPTSLLARIIFRFVTTGLILCTPFYATN